MNYDKPLFSKSARYICPGIVGRVVHQYGPHALHGRRPGCQSALQSHAGQLLSLAPHDSKGPVQSTNDRAVCVERWIDLERDRRGKPRKCGRGNSAQQRGNKGSAVHGCLDSP